MQCLWTLVVGLLVVARCHGLKEAQANSETPTAKVVAMLENMQKTAFADEKSEQASYDAYTAWAEATTTEKTADISAAGEKIEDLSSSIIKNQAILGYKGAEITGANKDIAEATTSLNEAAEMRKQEAADFEKQKISSESGIAALGDALKVLDGAGTGKKGFLETLQEAKLLSVVAGIRPIIQSSVAKKSLMDKDFEVVSHFVEKPDDFLSKWRSHSALQVSTPGGHLGDYAPQSTQIQGILGSMFDEFTADLKRDSEEEEDKKAAYQALTETKTQELDQLNEKLDSATKAHAEASKSVADDKAMRDETQDQLKADQKFLAQTKSTSATRDRQWTQRSKLRAQEISGITQVLDILNSTAAKKLFESASESTSESTSFLQVSEVVHPAGDGSPRTKAYKHLRALASRFQSLQLAQLAVKARTAGHFDDIIAEVDKMTQMLREEEQEDITHRDRCETKKSANVNAKANAEGSKEKHVAELLRVRAAIKIREAEMVELDESLKQTKEDLTTMTQNRAEEKARYEQTVKDDRDSIALLEKAAATFQTFYDEMKTRQSAPSASFLQVGRADPEEGDASSTSKTAPNLNYDDEYKGKTLQAGGVMAALEKIIDDLQMQIKQADAADVDAASDYKISFANVEDILLETKQRHVTAALELAGLKSAESEAVAGRDASQKDIEDEQEIAKAIETDCDWVASHFETRLKARKDEMDGLVEAKAFLSGAITDDDFALSTLA